MKMLYKMKYCNSWLIEKFDRGEKIKFIIFWSHESLLKNKVTAACFSQWWKSNFLVNGVNYKTSEHWMMAQKAKLFGDEITFNNIINSNSPAQAKDLGRRVKHFNEKLWLEKRFEIVKEGNYQKFIQNEELKFFLINTNERIIVEASPVDCIWGVGLSKDNEQIKDPHSWKGLNLLGYALMEVRDLLRERNS